MDKALKDLSDYRLEQAKQCIKAAKLLLDNNDYMGAANRSYYAVFHCMRSVLALEQVDFKRHSGVSSHFRNKYIKTGIFDSKLSDIITDAFEIRNDSDYDDFFVVSKEEIEKQLENAELFYDTIKKYLLEL